LYESNPTRYKEGLESAQAEFDKALAEYRSATTRSEELKGLPDTDKDKRMVRELEQMAEFRLGRAITRLNNAKAAPQLDKALDGPNKELNDAFDELKKYPMPEGAPAEGEAWDNFRRAFKRFQDAKSAYDAALAKAWGDYSASGAANQAASKTASMPERPLLPGEKTRPLGNSPTVCGEAPAPLASGAGMGGVAQAVNNK
jgi:hypothetical protein